MKSVILAALFIASCSLIAGAQTQSHAELLKDIETKRADLAKLEQKFLAPSAEDRAAYAEFLAQPDTDLIRLLPREVYDPFANKKAALTVRGGGAYYSFRLKTHEYGYASDIGFEHAH